MKLNLDSLRSEIQEYLESRGLAVFHSLARGEDTAGVYWNVESHPDYRAFLATAETAGVRLFTLYANEFTPDVIDEAMERLTDSGFNREDRLGFEQRLRELRPYIGFTCEIELSFDLPPRVYIFDLRTEWFEDLNEILDQIEDAYQDPDEGESMRGYFSKN